MHLILRNDAGKEEIAAIEKILFRKNPLFPELNMTSGGFNAKKYNGIFKLKKDPMVTQKSMRDEWERDFS